MTEQEIRDKVLELSSSSLTCPTPEQLISIDYYLMTGVMNDALPTIVKVNDQIVRNFDPNAPLPRRCGHRQL